MKPDPVRASVQALLPSGHHPGKVGEAYAPANIALCKYWGKRDEALKLPQTGSLSVSLGAHGTRARLETAERDGLWINDREIPASDKAFVRMFAFLDLMRAPGQALLLRTHNTVPMAAGLASSASAFAAVTLAMDRLYAWNLDGRTLSILARIGSGSAARSVFDGFVEWHAGTRADGMDSFAEPVAPVWPDFRIGILTVSEAEKAVGSSEGMRRTMETAPLYAAWPAQVARDLPKIRQAILDQDFATLGRHAEQNALAMHATMIGAWPPVIYWRPETVAALHRVHALRAEGIGVYATLDAGPNVKLLHTAKDAGDVQAAFPNMITVGSVE